MLICHYLINKPFIFSLYSLQRMTDPIELRAGSCDTAKRSADARY
jgi:hypothetical protein